MNTQRWLQFHTAALACMGTWLLAWDRESMTLPLALTGVALASLLPAPFAGWMRVNRLVANIAALAAVAWSLHDFFDRGSELQLLAIADMLICLQMVLLFQEKSDRVHWQLLVLSVLQVVVAAALNLGPQFALLLIGYMTLALSTLVLLCLSHESRPQPAAKVAATPAAGAAWQQLMAPVVLLPASGGAATPGIGLSAFLREIGVLTVATVLFAIVFFYATPRHSSDGWQGLRSGGGGVTGFSSELRLEESGRIIPSNQLVMRVRFTRMIDDRPYPLIDEPYFQGAVLTEYRSQRGSRWVGPSPNRLNGLMLSRQTNLPTSALALVRQDISLENSQSQLLFAVMPIHPLQETPNDLKFMRPVSRLMRVGQDDMSLSREYRYAIGTMAFRDGRQLRAIPHINPLKSFSDGDALASERDYFTEFDADSFPELTSTAEQVIAAAGIDAPTSYQKAMLLQNHFHQLGLYTYSLNLDFVRDQSLDPVEDFVRNHRKGHCEYFASALALMLRSQGIPSRIVNGYRGGEFNSLGSYYQVRQKHAHAWVEALIDAPDVPTTELAGSPTESGAWFRLDPTPSAQRATLADERPLGSSVGDTFDYIDLLWRDYVLGLNSERQKGAIVDPLINRTAGSIPTWMEVTQLHSSVRDAVSPNKADEADKTRTSLTIRIALTVAMFSVAAAGFSRMLWSLLHRMQLQGWLRGFAQRQPVSRPGFYRRLEQVLGQFRLRRAAGQTQREFAQAASASLAVWPSAGGGAFPADLSAAPPWIVAAYYRVRFGGEQLSEQETAAIDAALVTLAASAKNRKSSKHLATPPAR